MPLADVCLMIQMEAPGRCIRNKSFTPANKWIHGKRAVDEVMDDVFLHPLVPFSFLMLFLDRQGEIGP